MAESEKRSFTTLLFRSLRRRCPMCGQAKMFRRWIKMHERCPACDVKFEREPGFFLGSIYFNYGLTALVLAVVYPVCIFTRAIPHEKLVIGTIAFAILFPIWFFPFSRSLWLGFDQFCDPRDREDV